MPRTAGTKAAAEQRVLEIMAEILNGVSSIDIARKYTKLYNVKRRQIDSYIRQATDKIREHAEQITGNEIQESIKALVKATPKAIKTLELALDSTGEDGKPNPNAIRAAAEIIHKSLPDNLRIEEVKTPLTEDEIDSQFNAILDKARKIKSD